MPPKSNTAILAAPAKINFGLRVTGRRADGYHELESVFLPLDLCDDVEVRLAAAGDAVDLQVAWDPGEEGPPADALGDVPADASNLAARAGRAFLRAAGVARCLEIRIVKRIPAAAGLGGGSSDAGAVLRGLDALLPGAVDRDDLARIALGLGADVPYFLSPMPARVRGIGEQVEPLLDAPALALLLANPGIPLATPEVFRIYDSLQASRGRLTPDSADSTMPPLAESSPLQAGRDGAGSSLAGSVSNDLTPAAVRLCPPVARLLTRLRVAGALAAEMSGSGATVFGVFADRKAAEAALQEVRGPAAESPEGASARAATPGPDVWARVAATVQSGSETIR